MDLLKSIILVLSHMTGYVEQKLLGRSQESYTFLKSNFVGSGEKFWRMYLPKKKFCGLKSRLPDHLPYYKFWTILALYRLFLGRFQ
jgi:hypothetical protein